LQPDVAATDAVATRTLTLRGWLSRYEAFGVDVVGR
jgi:hypothetical protein